MERRLRRLAALIAAIAVACALGACGGKSKSAGTSTATAASAATVRSANCMLWNVFDRQERLRLVRGLRVFFQQRLDTGARERVIPDERAYRVITAYCKLPFARAFLIYRLYGNANAFAR